MKNMSRGRDKIKMLRGAKGMKESSSVSLLLKEDQKGRRKETRLVGKQDKKTRAPAKAGGEGKEMTAGRNSPFCNE